MTNPVPVLSDDALREIEARADTATDGPWAVWDSCSWRRIGTKEPYQDGNVVCPVTQSDGHPDLLAKREDLEFIAHAREDIPALCQTVRALRTEHARLLDLVRYCRHQLHDDGLITNAELAALVDAGPASVTRLESYDALREQLAQLEERDKSRVDDIGILQSQLAQVTQERDELRKERTK